MSVLFVVYRKEGKASADDALTYLSNIRDLGPGFDRNPDEELEGYAQTMTDERGGYTATLFKLIDSRIHLDRFHLIFHRDEYPLLGDQVAMARFTQWIESELLYWARLIDLPVAAEIYTTASHLAVQVLNSKLPAGGFDRIHDIFVQDRRSRLTVVKDGDQ